MEERGEDKAREGEREREDGERSEREQVKEI